MNMTINKKVFKSTEIFTESQSIRIQPNPEFDGITLEFKESADINYSGYLYLDREEANAIISEINNMLNYIK